MKQAIITLGICLLLLSCKKDSPTQTELVVDSKDGITANYKISDIATIATAMDATNKFKGVWSSNVNINGTSKSWRYLYGMSVLPGTYYCFTGTFETARFDSTEPMGLGAAFVTHPWINSSDALKIAEQNGGEQFRAKHPDYVIQANMGEALVANPTTTWGIIYSANSNRSIYFSITIDATTSKVNTVHTDNN